MPQTAKSIYLYARARAGGGWGVRGEGGTMRSTDAGHPGGTRRDPGSVNIRTIGCDTTDSEAVAEALHAGIRWHIRRNML